MKDRVPELDALGARMKRLRDRIGISQGELADRADLHPKHVSEIERGNKDPKFSSMLRLAGGLEVSVGALVGEVQPQPIREDRP